VKGENKMLLSEWERSVAESEKDFQKMLLTAENKYPLHTWVYDAIQNHGSIVYDVAEVFYASDSLDDVPNINGPNRHRVFVDWISRNTLEFENALNTVEQAMLSAKDGALARLHIKLDH
jgi:hypothetical protein